MRKIVWFMIVALVATAGCSKSENGPGATGEVVAKVGDKEITATQVERFMESMPPQVMSRYDAERIRREIVDGFVNVELFAQEARRRGIDKRDDVKLKLELLMDQALAREVEQDLKKGITVPQDDLKKYYEENRDRYAAHTRYRVRRITVPTLDEAKAVLARINKGEDFSGIARQVSKDEYASRGGSMGIVRSTRMPDDLKQALGALKEGEVSKPIKTDKGYVIVRVDRATEIPERPFDQVRDSIERNLMRDKMNKAVAALKDELKKKTKVEINEAYFAKYRQEKKTSPQPAGAPDFRDGPPPAMEPEEGMGD